MTVVVTVRIATDVERAKAVEREYADSYRAVVETARKHGLRSHRRLYGDGEILDVDEWRSLEGRKAFLDEAAPHLRRLQEARGSGPPEVRIWRPDEAESSDIEARGA